MKLRFNLLWSVVSLQFSVSFLHRDFHSHQAPLIWLIAPDALSHGQNMVLFSMDFELLVSKHNLFLFMQHFSVIMNFSTLPVFSCLNFLFQAYVVNAWVLLNKADVL